MTQFQKPLYTAQVHTTGGREGESRSSDGRLLVKHSLPGAPGNGTNPEQLFAAGWSACFLGAIGVAAHQYRIAVPKDAAVDAEIDLVQSDGAYSLQARLDVSLPGIGEDVARKLVDAAHATCPYSKATRGNIAVDVRLV